MSTFCSWEQARRMPVWSSNGTGYFIDMPGRVSHEFLFKEGRVSAGSAAEYVPENSPAKLAEAIDRMLRDQPRREAWPPLGWNE